MDSFEAQFNLKPALSNNTKKYPWPRDPCSTFQVVYKISYAKPSEICYYKLRIPETSWIVFTAPRFYFWTGCVNSLAFVASFELLITNFWPPTTKFSYLVTSSPPCSTCPPWGQDTYEMHLISQTPAIVSNVSILYIEDRKLAWLICYWSDFYPSS